MLRGSTIGLSVEGVRRIVAEDRPRGSKRQLFPWRLKALPLSSSFFRACQRGSRKPAKADRYVDGHDTRAIQDHLDHRSIASNVRYTALAPDRFKGNPETALC